MVSERVCGDFLDAQAFACADVFSDELESCLTHLHDPICNAICNATFQA